MCTCARVAVAVKSKIRSDLILGTSIMVFAAENAPFALQKGLTCWSEAPGFQRCGYEQRWPSMDDRCCLTLFGPWAHTLAWHAPYGVKTSEAVVMASDGPVLGWGKRH